MKTPPVDVVKALGRIVPEGGVIPAGPGALGRIAGALGLDATPKARTKRRNKATVVLPAAVSPRVNPPRTTERRAFRTLLLGDIGFGEAYVEHPRAAILKTLLAERGHGASLERLARLLGTADYTVGNLEVPLEAAPSAVLNGKKQYVHFADPVRTAEALKLAGIDALSLANNHALDAGEDGLARTIARLETGGFKSFGAGPNGREAGRPLIQPISVGGRTVTLVIFGGFQRRRTYRRDLKWYAGESQAGVNALDPRAIGHQIADLATELESPLFVAFPHWGVDYNPVTAGQEDLAVRLVEAGVDLVVGHGAHTLQTVEMVHGRPVVYGIGNFVWNTPGRFKKTGAPPFGAACALDIAGPDKVSLRVFPILTDTAQTAFRNRPVTPDEFEDVERLLAPHMGAPLSTGRENGLCYLELVFADGRWSTAP